MNNTGNTNKRAPLPSSLTIGLVLVAFVAAAVLVYMFASNANQDFGGGQQVDTLATAYPAGTSQGDSVAADPIAAPPSDDITPPYPGPESRSQAPPPEDMMVDREVTRAGGVLGVVVDESYTVLDVEARGAADRAGIQAGDTLISIDGVPLTSESVNKAKQAIWDSTDAGIEIVIVRDAQTIQLRVAPSAPASRKLTPTPVVAPEDYL